MDTIQYTDFEKIDMRVGTVTHVNVFEKAIKPAYQLTIDFGPLGTKKSSAQITEQYTLEELIGKQVVAVVNFPAKQIADYMSECLVLGVIGSGNGVVLLTTDKPVANGMSIA
jgi:tRNA-binding protein